MQESIKERLNIEGEAVREEGGLIFLGGTQSTDIL